LWKKLTRKTDNVWPSPEHFCLKLEYYNLGSINLPNLKHTITILLLTKLS
jgi:hypothetical protein